MSSYCNSSAYNEIAQHLIKLSVSMFLSVYLRTVPYAALVESSISSYCTADSCSVAGLNSTCSYRWSSPAAVADEGSSYLALVLDEFGRAPLGEPMHVHVCRA